MKTEWDYTNLASAYLRRPDYSSLAIDALLRVTGTTPDQGTICDVGAGVGHLTLEFARRGFRVVALEPNDAMRAHLVTRVADYPNVTVKEAVAEDTGESSSSFDLITFGSSFNVTNRPTALAESARVLRSNGWFVCLFNHRDLSDPIQNQIERIILKHIPNYSYGARREDQTGHITTSHFFPNVVRLEGDVVHNQSVAECIEAWRSHATLAQQAKGSFELIVDEIESFLISLGRPVISIPYTTRIWLAQRTTPQG